MATEFSFDLNAAQLKLGPKELDRKIQRAAYGTVRYHDGAIERWMKHKAPWKDRTTNARNGLFAKGIKEAVGRYAIIIGHSVTYGIYLELGHDHQVSKKDGGVSEWSVKPYPIIVPALNEWGPKVMKTFSKLLDRL